MVDVVVSVQLLDGALELSDVVLDLFGDELNDVIGQVQFVIVRLALDDGDARLQVRWLDVCEEAPLEPGADPVFQVGDLLRRPVRSQDDLLLVLDQRVERVEELFLGPVFTGDELDVVDEQDIDRAVFIVELLRRLFLDAGDEFVGKVFTAGVEDLRVGIVSGDAVADRVKQMRFAEARVTVDEQRVVGLPRRVGDGERCRVREGVGGADDEGVEGQLVVHHGVVRVLRCFFCFGGPVVRLAFRLDDDVDREAHIVLEGLVQQVLELAADDVRLEVGGGQDDLIVLERLQFERLQPQAVDGLTDLLPAVASDQFPDVIVGVHCVPLFH